MNRDHLRQLAMLIHDLEAIVESNNPQAHSDFNIRKTLNGHLEFLKQELKETLEFNQEGTPLRQAFRHIRHYHPEVNTVLAVYRFKEDCPAGCPYYLSLNDLYRGT
jgi:hypothetical protein